ncbi:hypothetical protein ACHAP5_008275 [Fusarium lateritium]
MDAIGNDTEDISASPRRIPEQRLSVSSTSRHSLCRIADNDNALTVFEIFVIDTCSISVINAEPERSNVIEGIPAGHASEKRSIAHSPPASNLGRNANTL